MSTYKRIKVKVKPGPGSIQAPDLPVHRIRDEFIETILAHNVVIVAGETACGKTTQIPQFILDDRKVHDGKMIAVTQPRRIAAVSLAKRVAEERGEEVGGTVGYAVRFDERMSSATKLKYMTDGILLKEVLSDPYLSKYSVVILDEVHERTLNTDLLLGILQNPLHQRNKGSKQHLGKFNVVIMSATMNAKLLSRQFPEAAGIYITGRRHQIQNFDLVTESTDYISAIVAQVCLLHQNLPFDQHILAFLPGKEEITTIVSILKSFGLDHLEIFPLYAALSHQAQMRAIEPTKKGLRRVIVSTNIAETSLTIPGIRVVIDSGFVNRKINLGLGYESLQICRISQAESYQRAGRAGREAEGTCYRVYTKEFFAKMRRFPVAEIKRANISTMLLTLLGLGVSRPSMFPWLEPPTSKSLKMAIQELKDLSAVTSVKEPMELTHMGQHMALAPIEPKFAKVLLLSMKSKLLKEAASVLAILSSEPIFNPCKEEVEVLRSALYHPDGDLLTYLNVMNTFRKTRTKKDFSRTYKLNLRSLRFACKVRQQLIKYALEVSTTDLSRQRADEFTMSEDLRRLFISVFPLNVAQLDDDVYRIRRADASSMEVKIHPGSTLIGRRARIVHFIEVTELGGGVNYITHVSHMQPVWVGPVD